MNIAELTKLVATSPSPGFMKDITMTNEAKYNLGKVKTKPMPPFYHGYLVEGCTPERFAGALPCALLELLFGCWLRFPPSALITQGKHTFFSVMCCQVPGKWTVARLSR